jgi:hypothetical protein
MYILNPKQDGGLYSYYECRGCLDFWWVERCRGRHFLDGEENGNSEDLSENVKSTAYGSCTAVVVQHTIIGCYREDPHGRNPAVESVRVS